MFRGRDLGSKSQATQFTQFTKAKRKNGGNFQERKEQKFNVANEDQPEE